MRRKGPPRRIRYEEPYKVNGLIEAFEVRVVGEGTSGEIYSTSKALKMAKEEGLDLVEISSKTNPPICKITDYSKFKYEEKKKQKSIKANSQKTVVKEIRFGPNTDDHDYNFKLKHAINFLEEGSKVRIYVHFRGRSIIFKDRGEILLLKFAQALESYGKVEQLPKMEGKRMFLMISPKSKR